MGDLADDCHEAAMREMFSLQETVARLMQSVPSQKVVDDILQSFREEPVDKHSKGECLARDILITTAKRKTLSPKQKVRLVEVLVIRCADGYECDYDL
ncbi:hypothetical protein [Bacillus cereus group sp. Bce040]|uniref:hypothetical protein n=1 Tax=Bacillus cereus group sp. Bce040 TaxID=3445229 RepID=UPI003F1F755D